MSDRYKNHGCSAFAREDVDDAKRGHPDFTLEEYARSRGLEFHGRGRLAGFRMALPDWEEEQHNLMRGVLSGGRFGVLLHALVRTHSGGSDGSDNLMAGSFYSVRTSSPGGWIKGLKPNRTWLPYIGDFLSSPGENEAPTEAFAVPGAWAPATTVGTPVPETNALLHRVVIQQKSRSPWLKTNDSFDLDEFGAPGLRLYPGGRVDRDALTRLVHGPGMQALAHLYFPYLSVRVDYGMLTVTRNGYVEDPAKLDDFALTAAQFADALVAAAATGAPPQPFSDPLPPCPWDQTDAGITEPYLAGGWTQDLRAFADHHQLELEDPDAWHRTFGSLPLPGRVVAVMRNAHGGRVFFTTDVPIAATRALRGAVAVPAKAGVADTPPGGVRTDFGTVAVRDGVAIAFTHRLFGYTSEALTLIDDALAALRGADLI